MRNIFKMLIGCYRGFLGSFEQKNVIFIDFHLLKDVKKSPINQIFRKKIFSDNLWNNGEHLKMLFGVLRGFLGVILGRKKAIFTYLETSKLAEKPNFLKKIFVHMFRPLIRHILKGSIGVLRGVLRGVFRKKLVF